MRNSATAAMAKVFGTHCGIAHYGKGLISIFHQFFASIDKVFILGGSLGARLQFHEVLRFS